MGRRAPEGGFKEQGRCVSSEAHDISGGEGPIPHQIGAGDGTRRLTA